MRKGATLIWCRGAEAGRLPRLFLLLAVALAAALVLAPQGAAQGSGDLPDPEFRENVNLIPISGEAYVREPGSNGWEELEEPIQVRVGTRVDATDGRVELISRRSADGPLESTELWAGPFLVNQAPSGITVLRLAQGRSADDDESGELRLWGRGDCQCRHLGSNSSGTSRGTWWLTIDGPDGTMTRVKEGEVVVNDFTRGRTQVLGPGEEYLAPATLTTTHTILRPTGDQYDTSVERITTSVTHGGEGKRGSALPFTGLDLAAMLAVALALAGVGFLLRRAGARPQG